MTTEHCIGAFDQVENCLPKGRAVQLRDVLLI
jgi:hypothetical protein